MKPKSTLSTKRGLSFSASIFLSILSIAQLPADYLEREKARDAHEKFIQEHPFSNRPRMSKEDWKKIDKRDRPDLGWEQNFLLTMDPVTRKPERERLYNYIIQRNNQAAAGVAPGATGNNWVERGPNNIGGRTRALAWDPTSPNKVWAGGVTGGLWFNNNIHSASSAWQKVNDFWDNIAVTAIAFDPNNNNTMYVGTGEGWGTGSSIGGGIWKSTNGGSSFTVLSSTTSTGTQMSYINDLVVRNEGGSSVVYAAVSRMSYNGQFHGVQGLYRSTNGGTGWAQVLPNVPSTSQPYAPADLEIDAGNRLWVGTRNNSFGDGGGTILHSDNGTTWTTSYTLASGRRVELACAPSNQNVAYAIISALSSGTEVVDRIIATSNRGSSWGTRTEPNDADNGIPSTDFSRGQAWYDLILRVDPNNQNTVYAGAINWFRTTNGGFSWTQISKWSNNANMNSLSIPFVHADQHAMEFKGNSSDTVIIGSDGGVNYSANLSTSTVSNLSIPTRNNGYNVTQFYSAALHPNSGNNHMLAGSQDNGTLRLNTAGVGNGVEIRGGDGAFCFIDQNQPQYQIASYVYNSYYLSTNGGTTFFSTQLIRDLTTGSFINPADYDNNRKALFAARTTSTLTRIRNITGSFSDDNITVTGMNAMASAIKVSPHTTSSSTVFVGTRNGRLYKVTTADGTPSTSRIDNSAFPSGSISCVQVGGSEDTLLVTLFNYGVNSVWYTTNGGTNWVNKDNSSLPDMPVRWALFNPFQPGEVILATELGVWTTSDISVASPTWTASNGGLANVRVDMLQMRNSDSTVMASTHGRGVFTSKWASNVTSPPNSNFTANDTTVCVGDTVSFTNTTSGSVTSRAWTFNGGTPSTSTATSPQVRYNTAGTYTVRLISTNGSGSDTITKVNHITVSANPSVSLSAFAGVTTATAPFALSGGSPAGGTYSGPGVSAGNFNPASAGVGTHTITYTFTNANGCSGSASRTITVTAAGTPPNTGFTANDTTICVGDTVLFTNTTTGSVTSRTWTFNGGSPSSSTALNPQVRYNTAGTYTVRLISTNGNGSDTVTKVNHITVNANPTVSLAAFAGVTTATAPFALTGGSPAGGSYSGPGVSGGNFNPASAGVGTHSITYSFTNANGCTGSASRTISVSSPAGTPTALYTVSDSTICEGESVSFSDVSLGSPTSRQWIFAGGSPTNSSAANPNVSYANPGTYTVILRVTNANGSDTITKLNHIIVSASPSVALTAFTPVGYNTVSFALTGGSPLGGVYSGPGVSAGNFTASAAGVGSHSIKYVFTSPAGCQDSATQQLIVNPEFSLPASVCEKGGLLSLSGTPAGGTFSGTGVVGSNFNPLVAGGGSHTLTYTVSGRSVNASTNVTVNPVNLGSISNYCDNEASFSFSTGTPAGGTYSVNGTTMASFNPSTQGPGSYTVTYTLSVSGCVDSSSQSFTVFASPNVSLAAISNQCAGNTAFNLTGGSPGPGNYFVNGSVSGSFNPSSLGAGTHTVKYDYVDANFCRDSAFRNVVVFAQPNVSLAPLTDVCANDAAFALTGGTPSGGTYSGSGVSAGFFNPASVVSNNTYNVTYRFTDANACTDSASRTILVKPIPLIRASNDTAICFGASVQMSAGGGVNYSWTPATSLSATNVANPTASPLITTRYFVSGTTFNGCSNVDSVHIVVNPIPNVNAGTDITICNGESFQLNGIGAANYAWSPASGLSNPNIANPTGRMSSSQTYVLTGTSSAGCTNTDTVIVQVDPKPVVNAGLDTSICEGETYTLMATGANSYVWSPATGLSSTSIANPNYQVNGVNTITVIGTNLFGCSDTDAVTITGKGLPVMFFNPLSDMCLVDAAKTLNVGSPVGGRYSGSGVVAGQQFRPNLAGVGTHVISYEFTASNGCSNSISGSQTVHPQPNPVIAGLNQVYCETDPAVALNLSPSGGTLSGNGVVLSSFVPGNAGLGMSTISYSVTDSNSCSASVSQDVRVSEVLPVSEIKGFKRVLKNRQYTYRVDAVNGAMYQWRVINGTLVAQANNVATVQWGNIRDGRLIVIQTSLDGCSDSTETFVSVGTVGSEELIHEEVLKVYPNPAHDILHIEPQYLAGVLEVFTLEGKLILNRDFRSSDGKADINISEWPRGIYNLRWTGNTGTQTVRIVLN